MINLWNHLTLFGAKTEYNRNTLRDLRLINAINLFFIVLFAIIGTTDLVLFFTGKTEFSLSTINTSLIALFGFVNLSLINRGLFNYVKFIIIIVFPFLLLILPLLEGHVINEYFFWYPYISSAFCIVPHLLFRQKGQRVLLFVSLFVYLAFSGLSDQLLLLFNKSELSIVPIVIENILFYRISSISIFLFINASMLYFLTLINKYEAWVLIANTRLEEQSNELRIKNNTLSKQGKIQKEKNRELEYLLTQLKTTQAQLIQTEKMASLGTLTSGVAKEINSPLNFISTGLNNLNNLFEQLKENSLSETEKINVINKCVNILPGSLLGIDRITRIIQSLVSFSENTENVKIDIHKIINSTLMIIGFKIPENITLEKKYGEHIPQIHSQKDKIHQAIIAILDNAIYFLNESEKTEKKQIIIETFTEENNNLCISISNNGLPIKQKHLGKIFDPFFTTKPKGKGLGLGLTNAYNNIKALNGEIQADNKNEFVIFTIKLPLIPAN